MKIEDKLVASVINGLKALYGQEVPDTGRVPFPEDVKKRTGANGTGNR